MQSLSRPLILAALALSCAFAQSKPDFSGTWKLNASKSDFGPMAASAPANATRTIQHKDPELKYTLETETPNGTRKQDLAYKTDGSKSKNTMGRAGEVESVATWKGEILTITSEREIQGAKITQVESWTLSPDQKVLTVSNKINSPMGEFEIKMVMDKAAQ